MKRPDAMRRALSACVLAIVCTAWAQAGKAAEPAARGQWTPLPENALESMRGGFELPSGLVLSFGIERIAYVNGQLVATQRFDLGSGAAPQTLVVQVGEGNRIGSVPAAGVVIQNTLNNQHIQIGTRIDATVGTLGLFQSINVQDTLQNALNGAAGP